MARIRSPRLFGILLTVVGVHVCFGIRVSAQAWVPLKGEGTVTVTYQNYYITGHFNREGRKTPNGATHSKAMIGELNYGLTDTVGLNVSLPFIASKYTGPRPSYFVAGIETFPGPLDDGFYHGAFQDVRIEARRMFSVATFAVTPFIGGAFPAHQYETIGEAVPGRHRRELQLGANTGVLLDSLVPGAYVHARYTYTNAKREQNFPYRRSNIDLEGGSSVASRVAFRGLASWQFAHQAPTYEQLTPIWRIHDRFIVPNHFNLGVGASLMLTRSAEFHAVWVSTISGRGGAHIARMLSLGTTWSFGGGLGGLGTGDSPSSQSDARSR